jgi:hypothetical protein
MRMKFVKWNYLRVIALGGMLWMLTGCAHEAPAILPSARPDHKSAILYGRFGIGHEFSGENRLALWLQNLDAQSPVYIYFDPDQPVYCIAVKPGRYQVAGFVGVNRLHEIRGRRNFSTSRVTVPFTALPGSQIYLGDFYGAATFDGMLSEWSVKSATNNFSETTVEFREKYRNLMTVAAVSIFEQQAGIK